MSIVALKRKTAVQYENMSVGRTAFALNGTRRLQGFVGQTSLSRSNPPNVMRGNAIKGHGGCCGTYPVFPLIQQVSCITEDSNVVKSSVLSNSGMIATKYRWIRRPDPFATVKPDTNLNVNSQQQYIADLHNNTLASFTGACEITTKKPIVSCNPAKPEFFSINTDPTLSQYYPFDNKYAGKELWNYNKYFVDGSITNTVASIIDVSGVYEIRTDAVVGTSSLFLTGSTQIRLSNITVQPNRFSFAVWVKVAAFFPGQGKRVYSIQMSGGNGFIVFQASANQYRFDTSNYANYLVPPAIAPANVYNHFCVVVNGTNIRYYVNGVLQQPPQDINPATTPLQSTHRIGELSASQSYQGYEMFIDDLRFYNNKALSQDEITAIYNYRGSLIPGPSAFVAESAKHIYRDASDYTDLRTKVVTSNDVVYVPKSTLNTPFTC